MIFSKNENKLVAKREVPFKLEKDLQKLVENNLTSIFGLQFLATEVTIESYRFDSVAYSEEKKAFIIIEYKRGKNESLVDQGYAYLYTLLNRKADFVLLYNEVTGKAKGVKDFDWTQTRIIFISPQFTAYQKNATAFINMPFELYEVKQYEGGIVSVNQIIENKAVKTEIATTKGDDKISEVEKEVIVYTEEDSLVKGSEITKELYSELKERVLALGDIRIEPRKLYVAFKGKKNICDVVLSKSQVKVFINLKAGTLKDDLKRARVVKDIGHWGNGDYEVALKDDEDIEYIISLIRQSYRENG